MKLPPRAFERWLWRRIRPAWRAAVKRRPGSRPGIWTRQRSGSLGCFVLIVPPLVFWLGAGLRAAGWTRAGILTLIGLALTWLILIGREIVANALRHRTELAPLLWLPAEDDLIFARAWRRVRTFTWIFGCAAASMMGLHYLWSDFSIVGALKVAAVCGIASVAAETLFAIPASVRTRWAISAGFALFLMIMVTGMVQPVVRNLLSEHGALLNWLHPGGWIVLMADGIMHGGAPDGRAAMAVPLGLIGAAGVLARRYWRRQFSSMDAIAEWLAPGRFDGAGLPDATGEHELEPAALEPDGAKGATEIREILHDSLRVVPPVENVGWRGWMAGPRLNERERMLGFSWPLLDHWKIAWRWLGGGWLAAFLLSRIYWPQLWKTLLLAYGPPALAFFYLVTVPLMGMGVWAKIFPIGYRECARLSWKLRWPWLATMLLPAVCFGAAAAWLYGLPWITGAMSAAKAILFLTVVEPISTVAQFNVGTRSVSNFRWKCVVMAVVLGVPMVSCIAGAVAVFVPLPQALIVFPVIGVMHLGVYAFHRYAWDRRWFDLAPPPGRGWI